VLLAELDLDVQIWLCHVLRFDLLQVASSRLQWAWMEWGTQMTHMVRSTV
jgi:hypothetical protein